MATTSAHAGGMTLQINGERIRVEAPRNCNALARTLSAPGYYGTIGNIDLKGLGSKSKDDDVADTTPAQPAPAPAPVKATAPAPAPSQRQPHPLPPLVTVASTAPVQSDAAPPARPPAPATAAAPAAVSQPALVAAAAATSPLGIWSTEDNKGNVRIEECGAALCGYAANGEKILINMKPQGGKWTGRIHDDQDLLAVGRIAAESGTAFLDANVALVVLGRPDAERRGRGCCGDRRRLADGCGRGGGGGRTEPGRAAARPIGLARWMRRSPGRERERLALRRGRLARALSPSRVQARAPVAPGWCRRRRRPCSWSPGP